MISFMINTSRKIGVEPKMLLDIVLIHAEFRDCDMQ